MTFSTLGLSEALLRAVADQGPREVIPGFEPDPNAVAQTAFTQRGRGPMHGQRAGAREALGTGHV